jgi:hypothetical protein
MKGGQIMKIELGDKRAENFKEYAKGLDSKYDDNGFMLNIHAPKNLKTGEGIPSAVAVCKIVRVNEEG